MTLNRWLNVDRFCDYVLLMTLATHDDLDGAITMGRRVPQFAANGAIKTAADHALRFYAWDTEPALRLDDARDYFDPLSAALPEPLYTWLPILRQSALFRWHFAARS